MLVVMVACSTPTQPTAAPPPPATAAPVAAQPTAPPPTTDAMLAKIADEYLAPLTQQDKFGGAVIIVRDGKVVLDKAYGFADREQKKPIEADTQFFAPLAEPWAGAAAVLLQLQGEGKIALDDGMCTVMVTCADHYRPITFRTLLANAGGVPDYRFDAEVDRAIGGDWFTLSRYDNLPAAKFVKPLGLASVGQYKILNYPKVVTLCDGAKPQAFSPNGYYGSQVMSAADINKAVQALFSGKLLTAVQLEEMLKPVLKVRDLPGDMSHALGVYVGKDPTGHKIVAQIDTVKGFGAYWAHYPDDKLTVIVLNNVTDWENQPARVRDVGLELARLMFTAK